MSYVIDAPTPSEKPPRLERRFVARGFLALLCVPAIVFFATQARFGTPVVREWLPAENQNVQTYDAFRSLFGNDEFILVAWPNCPATAPELNDFADLLRSDLTISPGIESIRTSSAIVESVRASNSSLSTDQVIGRLAGVGCGINGEGYLTIKLVADSTIPTKLVIARIRAIASDSLGVPPDDLILAGEPYQVALIDQSSRDTIARYVLPSSIGALVVAWFCLGSFRLTGSVFAFAGIGQATGLALIAAWLGEMSAVLVVLPTLVFMLTLSAAVHLANYYADASACPANNRPESIALRNGWKPCLLATVTTAFGFASLAASSVNPVRQFGTLAAIGTLLSTALLLLGYPAMVWLVHRFLNSREPGNANRSGFFARAIQVNLIGSITSLVRKLATPISIAGALLFVAAAMGVPRLQTSTEFTDMFPAASKAVRDLRWVGENIGPIATLDVVVSTPAAGSTTDQVARISDLKKALEALPQVARSADATLFLPTPPRGLGIRNTLVRAVYRRKVADGLEQMPQFVQTSGSSRLWRLSLSLNNLRNANYEATVESIAEVLRSAGWRNTQNDARKNQSSAAPLRHLQSDAPVIASGMSREAATQTQANRLVRNGGYTITGMRSVVETAHTALLHDLGTSFLTAFLLITPVMMLITRSISSGLMLMLPNTLPVAIVFGAMGWAGIQLDVASILTASVALGIAVDDTLHFVVCYRRQARQTEDNSVAVKQAMAICGPPMLHTTLICTAAMLPFLFCDFLPTSKFALLMILILSGAIVGDLVLLPALLLSPLTRRLRPN